MAARAEAERRVAAAQSEGYEAGQRLAAEILRSAEIEADRIRTAARTERERTLAAARARMTEAVDLIVERIVSSDGRS